MHFESEYPARVVASDCGRSLIAAGDVEADVIVGKFTGTLLRAAEPPESEIRHALWLNDDEWLIPTSPARFANHSCDPNCKVNDDLEMVTIRPVAAGEELTFAYNRVYPGESPPPWDPRWSFRCACGAPDCQGSIDGWVYVSAR